MCASTDTPARYEPTLSGLPKKLKERVLELLADDSSAEHSHEDEHEHGEDCEHDHEEDHAHEHGDGCGCNDDERKAALRALSLVNKEWYSLVAPLLWMELSLYPYSTESLLQFVTDILPRVGGHVDALALRETPYDPFFKEGEPGDLPEQTPRAVEIVEAAERFTNADTSLAWELRSLRARNILLAQIVKGCPKVTCLDIQGPIRPMRIEEIDGEEHFVVVKETDVPSVALEAVKALNEQIDDLTLFLPPDEVSSEKDAAVLLAAFPNLVRLELNCFPLPPSSEASATKHRAALLSALSSLKKLEELDLGESVCVTDDFAKLSLVFPLRRLALGEYSDLSFASFVTLVERFSSTLESLELDGTPHAEDDDATAKKHLGKPLNLPKLVALEVATPHEAVFLRAFNNCPLEEIYVRTCPRLGSKDVVAFLEKHKKTLRQVVFEEGAIVGDDEEEEEDDEEKDFKPAELIVNDWCMENDIGFMLQQVEEEEDDDEEWEDEDDDEE
ncbi:hypothetical protein JCM8547_000563 [Rhodosporidiobolus lusitaniae]